MDQPAHQFFQPRRDSLSGAPKMGFFRLHSRHWCDSTVILSNADGHIFTVPFDDILRQYRRVVTDSLDRCVSRPDDVAGFSIGCLLLSLIGPERSLLSRSHCRSREASSRRAGESRVVILCTGREVCCDGGDAQVDAVQGCQAAPHSIDRGPRRDHVS
ncbi:unnamed protein product [Mycena citricolor]|uniref:Uncharacterized protein n=1 Tax=Mycena citricolor TaxID=2018698 RepID=A0AAD2GZ99_9AGAR|nr:unnamed protein product [Mycena citricolor]